MCTDFYEGLEIEKKEQKGKKEFGVAKSMAAEVGGPPSACTRPLMEKKLARPQKDQVINCPRCQSANTKFCYYNNYSLTQPRYFCKTCRRYWTEGGTLRNVPVGGGSRKNKIIKSTSSNITSSHKLIPDLNPPQFSSENPKILHDHHQGQDLNLGFHGLNLPHDHHYHHHFLDINSSSCANSSSSNTALNFLRNGIGLNNSFNIPMATNGLENNALFASGNFHQFQECKPTSLAFSINGNHDQYGNNNNNNSNDHHHQSQENNTINGSLMFTLGSAKEQSSTSDHHKEHGNGNGFWNGMLGGGGSW